MNTISPIKQTDITHIVVYESYHVGDDRLTNDSYWSEEVMGFNSAKSANDYKSILSEDPTSFRNISVYKKI